MAMVVRQIKCSGCKATVNSFYVLGGKCPCCGFLFASSNQPISNTGLRQLKKDKREYTKNTISKSQIKKLFKLDDKQIAVIPTVEDFGQIRYKKEDVIKAIHTKK